MANGGNGSFDWRRKFSLALQIYALLAPIIVLGGWFLDVKIDKAVESGLEDIKAELRTQREFDITLKTVLLHYHEDANRFFIRGSGASTSDLMPSFHCYISPQIEVPTIR